MAKWGSQQTGANRGYPRKQKQNKVGVVEQAVGNLMARRGFAGERWRVDGIVHRFEEPRRAASLAFTCCVYFRFRFAVTASY